MLNRKIVLSLAAATAALGLVARCPAALPDAAARPAPAVLLAMADTDGGRPSSDHKAAKGEHEDDGDEKGGDKREKRERKEKVEQSVPMEMVPAAVLDAVRKECPGGQITEAELEAKKGKIMWGFDVTVGEAKYDVKVTVDGKFFSKEVDDEKDEKGEHKK